MYKNGVKIGIARITTRIVHYKILKAYQRGDPAYFAADRGTTAVSTVGLRIASNSMLTAGSTTVGFVALGISYTCTLLINLFTLFG